MQNRCVGDGVCLSPGEQLGEWNATYKCKFGCTAKNCIGKGCKYKYPEWHLKKNSGMCLECQTKKHLPI